MIVSRVQRGATSGSNEKSNSTQIRLKTNKGDDMKVSDNIRETEKTARKKIKSKNSRDENTKKTLSN